MPHGAVTVSFVFASSRFLCLATLPTAGCVEQHTSSTLLLPLLKVPIVPKVLQQPRLSSQCEFELRSADEGPVTLPPTRLMATRTAAIEMAPYALKRKIEISKVLPYKV